MSPRLLNLWLLLLFPIFAMDPHLFAAIRHRPAPTSRPRVPVRRASSLLAGVSDAERLEKALRRLEQLEPLIQKVQRSAVPFSAARGAPEVRAKLAEAKAAEAAARLVPVMEGNKETNSEEVDAFFDSTNELKRLVEVVRPISKLRLCSA